MARRSARRRGRARAAGASVRVYWVRVGRPARRKSSEKSGARVFRPPAMIGKLVRPVAGRRPRPAFFFRMSPNPPSAVPDRPRGARPRRGVVRAVLARCAVAMLALVPSLAVAEVQPPSTAPAVPGLRLPRDVVPLRYEPRLTIDPALGTFGATIDIVVRVERATDVVWLNAKNLTLRDAKAVIGGAQPEDVPGVRITGSDDVMGIRFDKPLPAGEARLVLGYTAAIDSVGAVGVFRQREGDRWYVVTQFEPVDARRAFPCFDEPDMKAEWRLVLVVPRGMRAFANMPVEREADVGAEHEGSDVRAHAAAADVPRRVRRGRLGRARRRPCRTQRHADLDHRAEGPRRRGGVRRRAHRRDPRGHREVLRAALSVSQARSRRVSALDVRRRDGEPRPRHVHVAAAARASRRDVAGVRTALRRHHRARDRPHVVRRLRDDGVVGRPVAQRVVRVVARQRRRRRAAPRLAARRLAFAPAPAGDRVRPPAVGAADPPAGHGVRRDARRVRPASPMRRARRSSRCSSSGWGRRSSATACAATWRSTRGATRPPTTSSPRSPPRTTR